MINKNKKYSKSKPRRPQIYKKYNNYNIIQSSEYSEIDMENCKKEKIKYLEKWQKMLDN